MILRIEEEIIMSMVFTKRLNVSFCSFLLSLILIIPFIACISNSDTSENTDTLPDLIESDTWSHRFSIQGVESTMTYEVVGTGQEGDIDYYLVESKIDPPVSSVIDSFTIKLDKGTRFILELETPEALSDSIYEMEITYTYEFIDCSYYPLVVGNECTVSETEKRLLTGTGKPEQSVPADTYITTTNEFIYRVSGFEEITVPAGTFDCFRVDQYNQWGELIRTSWKSPQLKYLEVEGIDYPSGNVTELISFDITPCKDG